MFHKVLALPPNTFRKVDRLAMVDWSPPPVLHSIQVTSVAAAARSALRTLAELWEPHVFRLRDTAWEKHTQILLTLSIAGWTDGGLPASGSNRAP
eukprot:3846420-Pyramimonas_sp.AAC.1